MLTLIIFLIALSVLILVHELGHFLAAKKAGVKVEEFGFGYPPRLWAKKIGDTVYSLNLLPIGGFVKLHGEELSEKVKDKKNAFWGKSKKARTSIILAGVLANFLLAVVIFSMVYSVMGIPTKTNQVTILGVVPGSPAEEAGFKQNDLVLKIDGEVLFDLDHFVSLVDQKKDKEVTILVQKEGQEVAYLITPRKDPPENEGPLGVLVSDMEMVHYPVWQMPFRGALEGFKEAFAWTGLIAGGLKTMVVNLVTKGQVPKDVAGPVGILHITSQVAQSGFWALFQFVGILSVNLMVLNILPFPALDGGRLMFVVYEALTRRRPKPEFERWVNTIGMVFLMFLVFLATINDLNRIWQTSQLAAQIRSVWPF